MDLSRLRICHPPNHARVDNPPTHSHSSHLIRIINRAETFLRFSSTLQRLPFSLPAKLSGNEKHSEKTKAVVNATPERLEVTASISATGSN
ncbi:hypothetical protein ACFL27_20325 [candidate division CSSED10-310 bacterium]|uniref:Uncharacterized protein n=1 Tax=candidate division CSSED10-310 bacterium TaxID=2855610 RepID=A0ABV6Z266_UNCC1